VKRRVREEGKGLGVSGERLVGAGGELVIPGLAIKQSFLLAGGNPNLLDKEDGTIYKRVKRYNLQPTGRSKGNSDSHYPLERRGAKGEGGRGHMKNVGRDQISEPEKPEKDALTGKAKNCHSLNSDREQAEIAQRQRPSRRHSSVLGAGSQMAKRKKNQSSLCLLGEKIRYMPHNEGRTPGKSEKS